MLLVAILYLLSICLVAFLEWRRISKRSADVFTIFLITFGIQIMIPACGLLFLMSTSGNIITYNPFITRILNNIAPEHGLATLSLSLYFLTSTYITWKFIDEKVRITGYENRRYIVDVSFVRWLVVVILGIFAMFALLNMLGDNIIESYKNLLILRSAKIGRNFITGKLFSFAQTFAILSAIGILLARERKGHMLLITSIILIIIFAFMSGARRTLGISLLIVYFSVLMYDNRFYIVKWILPLGIALSPLIMFGERIASAFAFQNGASIGKFIEFPSKADIAILFGEIGISVLESWATFLYLDMPFRFGVDHLLSIARRFPEGFLGIPFEFPERIVRISTAAFVGESALDVPPGLLGQMWLDAGVLGPVFWGIVFGIQLAALQYLYSRSIITLAGVGVLNCILFLILLPINTGSFDFSVYFDMILLVLVCAFILRLKFLKEV